MMCSITWVLLLQGEKDVQRQVDKKAWNPDRNIKRNSAREPKPWSAVCPMFLDGKRNRTI